MAHYYKTSKPTFASYYNMARQNLKIILDDIGESVQCISHDIPEDQLSNHPIVSGKINQVEKKEMILRKHLYHFPFLKVFILNEKDIQKNLVIQRQDISKVLMDLLVVVNRERNLASHYILNEREATNPDELKEQQKKESNYQTAEKRVVRYLQNCLCTAIRTAPDVFKFEPKELDFIGKVEKGKVSIKPHFSLMNKENGLSDMGRIFLICLLIEKRYVAQMLNTITGFYDCCNNSDLKKQERDKKRIRQVFSLYHLRLPKGRLDSETDLIALALDMLNELKKCPAELFDHISPSNQELFSVEGKDSEECEILLKRYSDRFPEFALRYIDLMKIFKNIRFQVNIGKYRYCFKESKHCADGIDRMRVLQDPINCFSRFDDAEYYRRTSLRNNYKIDGKSIFCTREEHKPDEAEDFPYITDSRARYMLDGDKVSMSWREDEKMGVDFSQDQNDGNIFPVIHMDKNVVPAFRPKCYMSIYEIPALVFHTLLYPGNEGNESPAEVLIRECVNRYRTFFQAVADGTVEKVKCADRKAPQPEEYRHLEETYHIRWKDIPKKIKDYLVGRTRKSFEHFAARIIDEMIDKTQYQLDCILKDIETVKEKKNNLGSRSFVEIKTGRLATALAKDIAMFQPSKSNCMMRLGKVENDASASEEAALKPDGSDKITGLNYRVVQAAIALYDVRREGQTYEEFVEMFRNARLIDSDNEHPFLESVLMRKPLNTVEFYTYYLEAKLNKLREIKKNKSFRNTYFLHADRARWEMNSADSYHQLALRYLEQPVDLPRGLFEESIRAKLLELSEDLKNSESYVNNLKQSNVAFMISGYFKKFTHDKNQRFYTYQRNYRLMDILYGGESKYFSLKKVQNSASCEEGGIYDVNSTNFNEHDFRKEISKYVDTYKVTEKGRLGRVKERPATDEEKEIEYRRLMKNYRDYVKNERALRRLQVQDFLMMAMSREIIRKYAQNTDALNDGTIDLFKLQDIKPNAEKGILSAQLPFAVTVVFEDGSKKKIYQDAIKIKNYGEFFRLLYDCRVRSLLPSLSYETIDKNLLEEELDNFDALRTDIFGRVLQLEKNIMDCDSEVRSKAGIGFRKILYSLTQDETDGNFEFIINVRNAFAHNKYPEREFLSTDALPKIISTVNEEFNNKVNNTIDNVKK